MSLLEQLTQSLGPGAMQQISQHLGTDHATAGTAVSAAIPLLLAALARNASTSQGAEALNAALAKDHDGSVLNDVDNHVSTFEGSAGSRILAHVLGDQQPSITTGLSQSTGLDASKTTALLAMLAPLVMGALGKAQRSGSLDAGGLASMLGQERERIGASQSGGLGSLLQLLDTNHDGSVMDDVMGMASKFLGRR